MIFKIFRIFIAGFLFVIFTGCSNSSKEVVPQKVKNEKTLEEMSFLQEFEEEVKVEKEVDFFEEYNRVMTSFNDGVYSYILIPVAKGYKYITPKELREALSNFFSNLYIPVSVVNNILQGELVDASTEVGRFAFNSTLGLGGLFDFSKEHLNMESKKEDFGQTLGVWGVESGSHIVLPILGPSNLRDLAGIFPDTLINPVSYFQWRNYNLVDNQADSLKARVFDRVNYTAIHDGEYEKIKADAIDLYPYFKNMYEQYRANQIKE